MKKDEEEEELYDLEKFCTYKVNSMMKPVIPLSSALLVTVWYFDAYPQYHQAWY